MMNTDRTADRQRITDELMAALSEPIADAPDFEDEDEAIRFACAEIAAYRRERRAPLSPTR